MTKIYKLLIDDVFFPMGTKTTLQPGGDYIINISNNNYILDKLQIENRPLVWELQEDKLDLCSPEAERMREESRATRYMLVPTVGRLVFCYDHAKNKACEIKYTQSFCNDWSNGFIKRTEEGCQAHGEKYARYFLTE